MYAHNLVSSQPISLPLNFENCYKKYNVSKKITFACKFKFNLDTQT